MMQEAAVRLLLERSRAAGWVAHARLLTRRHLRGTPLAPLQVTSTSGGLPMGVRSLRPLARLLTTC